MNNSVQSLVAGLQSKNVLDDVSIDRITEQQKTAKVSEKNQFLELMIAQLKNQNPLDPQDGAEFLSQLAQFSTVEGIQTLNDSMTEFSTGYRSGQALQATSLVGRRVEIPSETGTIKGVGGLSGSIDLSQASPNVELQIQNIAGDVVKSLSLGDYPASQVPFKWDGLDDQGQAVANGTYSLLATAKINGKSVQMPTQIAVNVNSVTLGADGEIMVNLEGRGSVPLTDLKKIGS